MPSISIWEKGKVKRIYLTTEERTEVERIKMANGLRTLKEAYEVWKQAKEISEDNNENMDVFPGILHHHEEDPS